MHINFIRVQFFVYSIIIVTGGLLINYVESYLPLFITRTFRYGKFSVKEYQSILNRIEVPKKWFKHFYMFAGPASSYIFYLIVYKYFWDGDIPKNVIWVLNMLLGSFRQPLVSPESTFVAATLFSLHCWKRFYETHYVTIFSNAKMNVTHYLVGLSHYIGALVSIIGESKGFVEGSEGHFSWQRITYSQLVYAVIFILSSYAQLRANYILRHLRKTKDGEVNANAYKIPYGGLYEYVSGALQITEIIIYVTTSIILWESSTFHYITFWVLSNQISTAVLTHQWYIQTFQSYPKSRKILIPYLL
ncbi:polyprenol reductase [Hylaeus volcanicus]|uniref:polyprenol reductase n=1 Tax=Hylaeus volcanicus TaxID=313075 RepID=UPI0023B85E07|nr:polyprenol reductase [Hylaeus volcanicus]XP_053992322.1 polyprenol reductase [Hylaeus volcanicus]XP_053992332.1 polyprenol reductase [Hylaeus volcanicus]XP_053992339.1 polyprenol reductase [Hylaeus volcanicus]